MTVINGGRFIIIVVNICLDVHSKWTSFLPALRKGLISIKTKEYYFATSLKEFYLLILMSTCEI